MKANELAKELLKNPDFDLEFSISELIESANRTDWGLTIRRFSDIEIGDIGYSDKVIILCGKEA